MIIQKNSRPRYFSAVLLSGIANFSLGASSLYWKKLGEVPVLTLVSYRVLLSTIILGALFIYYKNFNKISNLNKKSIIAHCTASFFIVINWGAFIWASVNDFVLESGLGYLLAPFISITLGIVFYNDQISRSKVWSVAIAFASIVFLVFSSENLNHLTYLLIALTWGSYTYIKKETSLNAINGLFLETLFLTLCILLAFLLLGLPIALPDELPEGITHLIWLAGIVSVTPLLMFSFASREIPLSLTGILQFILPLTLISIGLFFGDPEDTSQSQIIILAIISILLAIIACETLSTHKAKKPE
ncbi:MULTISPECIES: EamA family transporter [Pseudomonas]|uniref:EamA family transporter n=1 Tax=Pseudomonas TaxID=286 RepID=UPI0015E27372|nr:MULTISPECIES: EamA family transporter [Pseudomonas]